MQTKAELAQITDLEELRQGVRDWMHRYGKYKEACQQREQADLTRIHNLEEELAVVRKALREEELVSHNLRAATHGLTLAIAALAGVDVRRE